jgi:hypothetical protein
MRPMRELLDEAQKGRYAVGAEIHCDLQGVGKWQP